MEHYEMTRLETDIYPGMLYTFILRQMCQITLLLKYAFTAAWNIQVAIRKALGTSHWNHKYFLDTLDILQF